MSGVTNNNTSTKLKIALPGQMLPVLIDWPLKSKDRSGAYIRGDLRQLDPRDLDLYLAKKKTFEAMYGPTDADATELLFVIQLADALAAKSLPRVKAALTRWIGPIEADKALHWPPGSSTLRRPLRFIEALITRLNIRASNAAPVVYWSDKEQRMAFGHYCRDIPTALFLLAIEKVGVSSMGHCRGCGGVLIADRANKQFCDSNCRSRHFMRLMRERQKARKASKKRRKR
jgi:hypothetical protein